MRREPPILSNKVKGFSNLAGLLCCIYSSMAACYLCGAERYKIRVVIKQLPTVSYTLSQSIWLFLAPIVFLVIVTVGVYAVARISNSYIELYRDKVYIVPISILPQETLLERLFSRAEIQPEVFTYEELEDIQYSKCGCLIVIPVEGHFQYTCESSKKFAKKVIGEFQGLKAAYKERDEKGE